MPFLDSDFWSGRLQHALLHYQEPLLRQVAAKLVKPRNQWPVEELIERSLATIANAAVIDRRLQELEQPSRRVLALIGYSRQPRWNLGNLVEMVVALGHPDGLPPIFALFEAGLLYPDLPDDPTRLKTFEQWLGLAATTGLTVFAHPQITARAQGEDLGLAALTTHHAPLTTHHEADGLEWPLRLAVLWQQAAGMPLRRTQGGDFFKRDLERLRQDPLLTGPAPDQLADLADPGFLAAILAEQEGILQDVDGELRAAGLPASWDDGVLPVLEALWSSLFRLRCWNPQDGWRPEPAAGNPYPSAYLLAFLLLARLPKDAWADPQDLEDWLLEHHPYWAGEDIRPSKRRPWLGSFLLGLAYPLRLVQAVKAETGGWLVRLAPVGRWLLGLESPPAGPPSYPQTLLVQPNLDIIAYRQGLTPALLGQLTRFADWKSLGSACTLQLQPEAVYRALESGLTFETICRTLERHGMRVVPPAVIDSLRTWANKRERIAVYASATLFEFASPEDLNEALARGLPGTRIADRLALVPQESGIDFRHFRLTGTRDYGLPPEACVEVDLDGVTLAIDLARSDLLLESELQRFAEPLDRTNSNGRRYFRMTPGSLAAADERGMNARALDEWFQQRTRQPLSAAGRLLLTRKQLPPLELKRQMVLHVAEEEVADGLVQWPETRSLIEARLGPTALSVAEENVAVLRERLQKFGVQLALRET